MSNFEIALKEINDEWLASLPNPEDLPEPKLSKKYLRWERRVIRGKKPVANKVVKIILIAAALLIILSVAALSTDKGKEFILQFFKDSAVYSTDMDTVKMVTDLNVGYVPEEYELKYSKKDTMVIVKRYFSNEKWFEVQKRLIKSTLDVDYDLGKGEIFEYNGVNYLVIASEDDYISIIWNDGNYQYYSGGIIEKEELLKIAQNIS